MKGGLVYVSSGAGVNKPALMLPFRLDFGVGGLNLLDRRVAARQTPYLILSRDKKVSKETRPTSWPLVAAASHGWDGKAKVRFFQKKGDSLSESRLFLLFNRHQGSR